MKILLTGGTGFIGSHTAVVLLEAGHEVVLYDNLSNSRAEVVGCIAQITGKTPTFIEGDIRDEARLVQALEGCEAVIHFAGLKAVGESAEKPIEYYDNNVGGTICLLKAMKQQGVTQLIFSSSATVYGDPVRLPIDETHPTGAVSNPYGRTKFFIEEILRDAAAADTSLTALCLRYFNPVGAHDSALIGERPSGVPNNLTPYIAQTAAGEREFVRVFGNDYDTPDGTGVRDYIHVMDLAEGHAAALEHLPDLPGWHAINLGTGKGYSVLEMVEAFSQAVGRPIPYQILPRRPGDIATCFADPQKARSLLGWQARRGI
ncbi:MAG: UDP-glucose 4-epimerase GalE, partial [Zoogloeaceae bacterium]|nr:UDP-glucose 4-epimerase GalE [Zoogloeaceae bacterium]